MPGKNSPKESEVDGQGCTVKFETGFPTSFFSVIQSCPIYIILTGRILAVLGTHLIGHVEYDTVQGIAARENVLFICLVTHSTSRDTTH